MKIQIYNIFGLDNPNPSSLLGKVTGSLDLISEHFKAAGFD